MSLEYLLGHRIDSVSQPLKDKSWKWALLLDSGGRVTVTDDSPKPDSSVENTTIGTVHFGRDSHKLFLYRGAQPEKVGEIELGKDGYEIQWPKGMEVPAADTRDVEGERPADPSTERVADGPEQA